MIFDNSFSGFRIVSDMRIRVNFRGHELIVEVSPAELCFILGSIGALIIRFLSEERIRGTENLDVIFVV